jgi:glutamate carboxypeptidase
VVSERTGADPEVRARVLARLEQLVAAETPTGDAQRIDAAFAIIRSWLDPVFATPAVPEIIDGVTHLLWRTSPSPAVLLLGHVDTVWPVGTILERPLTIEGDRAEGPGTFDMKAGIVIVAEALARVARLTDVAVLLTSDEETGSRTSRAIIEREAAAAGAVLVLEPSLRGAVKVARRGGSIYGLDVRGRSAHAGLDPELGRSALTELAHQVLALPLLASRELGTTVTPTVARAGTVTNAIPDRAELKIDVRAWTMAELERVDAALAALPTHTADVAVSVTGGINRPPMEASRSHELLALAQRVASACGQSPVTAVSAGGASDGNFAAAVGTPTIDGLGPDGEGAHAADEWVSISSTLERIDLIAGMIDGLAGADEN